MLENGSSDNSPQLRVLSAHQRDTLVQAALRCLDEIGVVVHNAEARELLGAAGARVEDDRVRIPAPIVRQALKTVPREFTIWGRDPRQSIHVGSGHVYFGPGLTNSYFIDPQTGGKRPTRRGDVASVALISDALPNIDYVMGLGLISDVTATLAPVYEFAEMVANTTKPIIAWAYSTDNVAAIFRIAAAVAGGEEALRQRPNFALFSTYSTPLKHTNEDMGNVLWAAGHGIPVVYLGGPTLGMTSPASGASALVLFLAVALSGLAVVQLKHPGAPTAIGSVPAAMDLYTARVAYGAPETSLYGAAAAELAHHLGLPFMGTAGASDGKLLDGQATAESMVQVLMSALSSTDLVHDIGFLEGAAIGSLPLLVVVDELIGMTRRIMRGVEVSEESIMLDLIAEVGPTGAFIAEPRSARLCRQEIWVPTLMDRSDYTNWELNGAKGLEERAVAKLQHILEHHQPVALQAETSRTIAAILAEVEKASAPAAAATR